MRYLKRYLCLSGIFTVFYRLIEGIELNTGSHGTRSDKKILEIYSRFLSALAAGTSDEEFEDCITEILEHLGPAMKAECFELTILAQTLQQILAHVENPQQPLPNEFRILEASEFATWLSQEIPDHGWQPKH